jgi:hypothetical protein
LLISAVIKTIVLFGLFFNKRSELPKKCLKEKMLMEGGI